MTTVDRPTVDFDHHSKEFLENRHDEWNKLRERCPVAFNPNYGGFWVVSGHEEVARVSREGDTFTSWYEPGAPDGIEYVGISGVPRPQGMPPVGIAEQEGPVHVALRRVLNPYLLPLTIEKMQPFMERVTTWFLDQKIESGRMDLVDDLTNPVPAVLTMQLIGLSCDLWAHYGEFFHATAAYGPESPEYARGLALVPEMMAELLGEATARRQSPRDDLLTHLVQLEVEDGGELTDDELVAILFNLVGGGLDTTTGLTSLALYHLDEHPELRRQLIDHPELLPTATEEFLRYFSVNETLARTVTKDVELGGQQLARGDFVLFSWLAANHDEKQFECPGKVVLDRSPNPHLAFGVGPHRCIGMHLARTMFQVLMRAILERIPDYAVDRSATQFYRGPTLNGVVHMPATFTPGPVVGSAERPF